MPVCGLAEPEAGTPNAKEFLLWELARWAVAAGDSPA